MINLAIMEEIGVGTVGDDEYEHWPDDSTQLSAPSAVSGYDSFNGYREFQYIPADQQKKQEEAPKAPQQPVPQFYYQPPQHVYALPTPAYFLPPNAVMPAMPGVSYGQAAPGYMPFYMAVDVGAAAAAPPAEEKKKEDKPKKPEVKKWQGRTKAEVVSMRTPFSRSVLVLYIERSLIMSNDT